MENENFVIITCNNKQHLNFRMALNKTLNATCNLDGYLFCRVPEDALEVEVKIKTKWENTPCSMMTLTPIQKSTAPGTGQIGEVVYILEGEGHPKGRWLWVAIITLIQKLMCQLEKVLVTPLSFSLTLNLLLMFPIHRKKR